MRRKFRDSGAIIIDAVKALPAQSVRTPYKPGPCANVADVVTALYFSKMRHDPCHPAWPDRDRFLLSKGHAALVQYAALAECGYFPKDELLSAKCVGSILQPHEMIGIRDQFGQSAHSYDDLLEVYGLKPAHIAAAVRRLLAR